MDLSAQATSLRTAFFCGRRFGRRPQSAAREIRLRSRVAVEADRLTRPVGCARLRRSRATIDHAVGIVMATGGKSSKEAFQVLVRGSQRENRKLREIA
jgi:AmiR/NasT family two-component response regulator